MKTVVITGASAGIGKTAALLFAQKGWRVYGLSRRGLAPEGVTGIAADITDDEQVNAAFARIAAECGKVDVLINNAGFGISGAVEFTSTRDAQRLMDVDFMGTVRCARAAIPHMEKGGRIVNVSSVAAVFAIPFQTFYSAAKAAVNLFTLGLANELRPFGIKVCAVMPGDVRTDFTGSREKALEGDEKYGGRISKGVAVMEKDERGGMPPEKVARALYRAATRKHPPIMTTVGGSYRLLVFLDRLFPKGLSNFIVGKMYQ